MTLAPGERLIVDASIAVKWVVQEPDSELATLLLDRSLIVPDLFFSECANVLWKKLMRGDLTEDQAGEAARALEEAALIVVSTKGYVARAVAIAAALGHPAYDAIYLTVGEAFGCRFVTADQRLIQKVRQPPAVFGSMVVPLSEIV